MHEILPEDEVAALFERLGVIKEQLPKIKSNDSACRVLGAKAGDVLKITRQSQTAGLATAYRTVIEAF